MNLGARVYPRPRYTRVTGKPGLGNVLDRIIPGTPRGTRICQRNIDRSRPLQARYVIYIYIHVYLSGALGGPRPGTSLAWGWGAEANDFPGLGPRPGVQKQKYIPPKHCWPFGPKQAVTNKNSVGDSADERQSVANVRCFGGYRA